MSLYRIEVQDGVLVRTKRKLLRWWVWSFNRSEEEHIIRMKNEMTALRERQRRLARLIPEHEKRLKERKEAMFKNGGLPGQAYRDSWSARREPPRLMEDVKLDRKKKEAAKVQKPYPLATLMPGKG